MFLTTGGSALFCGCALKQDTEEETEPYSGREGEVRLRDDENVDTDCVRPPMLWLRMLRLRMDSDGSSGFSWFSSMSRWFVSRSRACSYKHQGQRSNWVWSHKQVVWFRHSSHRTRKQIRLQIP